MKVGGLKLPALTSTQGVRGDRAARLQDSLSVGRSGEGWALPGAAAFGWAPAAQAAAAAAAAASHSLFDCQGCGDACVLAL